MLARRAVLDWARDYVEDRELLGEIALAVTEAATNAVLHAFVGRDEPGRVVVEAGRRGDSLCLLVRDDGTGLTRRDDSPGLGLGLGLIAHVTEESDVRTPEGGGTEVLMRFAVAT